MYRLTHLRYLLFKLQQVVSKMSVQLRCFYSDKALFVLHDHHKHYVRLLSYCFSKVSHTHILKDTLCYKMKKDHLKFVQGSKSEINPNLVKHTSNYCFINTWIQKRTREKKWFSRPQMLTC